jgi:hypothetical protein
MTRRITVRDCQAAEVHDLPTSGELMDEAAKAWFSGDTERAQLLLGRWVSRLVEKLVAAQIEEREAT